MAESGQFYLKNVLFQNAVKTETNPKNTDPLQVRDPLIIPEFSRTRKEKKMTTENKMLAITRKYTPVLTMAHRYVSRKSFSSTSPGGAQLFSGIRFFHNLMNALAAEFKRICDLAQAHSLISKAQNFRVSAVVRRRAWLEWAPLPTANRIQGCALLSRKFSVLGSLAGISHPSPDTDFLAINNLNVDCWDHAMTFPLGELSDCLYVNVESGRVVHERHSNTFF